MGLIITNLDHPEQNDPGMKQTESGLIVPEDVVEIKKKKFWRGDYKKIRPGFQAAKRAGIMLLMVCPDCLKPILHVKDNFLRCECTQWEVK